MSSVPSEQTEPAPAVATPAPAAPGAPAAPRVQVEERKLTLHDFLRTCIRLNGSDVHFQSGSVPMIRVDGRARFLDCPPLTDEMINDFVTQILAGHHDTDKKHEILKERGAVDVAHSIPGLARFRTNIFHSREKFAIVMRRIVTRIPQFEELNLPPGVEALTENARGLVVISGTTGAGKSTTLAAMVGKINRTRSERIITIEDPIEFQHDNIKSLVSQVEVGTDTESYEYGLREMLRQDPDTILIGEIRDSFSLSVALRAADTGHLVFTTVHATNAPLTVERLVSFFDSDQKELQRTQLGMNLVGVVSQRLARRRDGKGRIPAVEIMLSTPLVRKYILDGEYDKLKGAVGNREAGCQSFDQHLAELFQKQLIDVAEAKHLATNVDAVNLALRGIGNNESRLR
jgi:twitching motility protein PilT